jgi:hypothetical protein
MIANHLFNSMNREGHRKDYFGFDLDEGFLSLSIFLYILFFMKKVLAKIFCPLHLETHIILDSLSFQVHGWSMLWTTL